MVAAVGSWPGGVARSGDVVACARDGATGLSEALGHSHIAGIQRARILAATCEVVGERGAGGVSVGYIVERSGVSRRTFYEIFTDCEECLLAAFDDAFERASECVLPAFYSKSRWSERVRAGLLAFLSFIEEQPSAGGLLVRGSLAMGGRVRERREQVLEQLATVIDDGRGEGRQGTQVPPLTAEGLVGGVLSILDRSADGESEQLRGLVNPLMAMIVAPYLGFAASRRELERPVESLRPAAMQALTDPFKPAGMRLTYRTVRVLLAVGEYPDASNRRLGDIAQVKDQGQISKLLGRLKRLGLIDNAGLVAGGGVPNAWSLTSHGQQVVRSIRAHTEHLPGE
ncbi:MAG: TetR/AcrR family transcriptional regulator [Solirubrobacteraceae bacterium]